MRIPIDSSISGLIETFEAFGYERLIKKMKWEWTEDGWHLKFSGTRLPKGYLRVGVSRQASAYLGYNWGPNTSPYALIHRLIYALEVGDLPQGAHDSPLTVDHIDGDDTNDNPANLQIMTRKANQNKWVGTEETPRGYCARNHPIVGENIKVRRGKSGAFCRYCQVHSPSAVKVRKSPVPPFHVWIIARHATKDDLAMLKEKGIPMPGVAA